jgi:hypothetical protein
LAQAGADLAEAAGQEEVISVWPLKSVVPDATLDVIVSWLAGVVGPAGVVGTERSAVVLPGALRAVVPGPGGEELVEEVKYLGPHRLFGVATRPPVPGSGATVVLLNSGRIDHVGPGRLWVELARSWAATGLEVLRVDLSGLGDSPARPGRLPGVIYSPDAVEDVTDVARAVSPGDPSAVVLMGLCSGAYHSVKAALATGARGVVAINLVYPTDATPAPREEPSAPAGEASRGAAADGAAGEAGAAGAAPGAAAESAGYRALLRAGTAAARRAASHLPGHHYLGALSRRASDVKWWVVHRARGGAVPAFDLRRLARKGVDTLVVAGSYEARLVQQGEGPMLWRLQKRGGLRVAVLPTIDHTLFTQAARRQVVPLVTERVRAQCATLPASPGAPKPGPAASGASPGPAASGASPGPAASGARPDFASTP